jgi:DNA helicase-2/ATP-dependent DNA helicase PcrA
MSQFLDELNPIQRGAVTSIEGPVLVIAGPGSGKTRVLTYRIAHLLQSKVPPREILALTFTNKSAREMKDRIERVVGSAAQQVWAGTFHSVFARILRYEADKIGYPSSFTIYDSDDTTSVIKAILKEMNLDTTVYNPSAIRSRISLCKSNLITPPLYRLNADMMQQDRAARRPYLVDIYTWRVASAPARWILMICCTNCTGFFSKIPTMWWPNTGADSDMFMWMSFRTRIFCNTPFCGSW